MLVALLRIKRYSQSVQRFSSFPSGLRQGSGKCWGRFVHGRQNRVFFSWYVQNWDGNKCWQSLRCALVSVYHPTLEVLDHDVVWWLTKFFEKIVAATRAFFHIFRESHEVIRMRRQSRVPRSCRCRWSWWNRQGLTRDAAWKRDCGVRASLECWRVWMMSPPRKGRPGGFYTAEDSGLSCTRWVATLGGHNGGDNSCNCEPSGYFSHSFARILGADSKGSRGTTILVVCLARLLLGCRSAFLPLLADIPSEGTFSTLLIFYTAHYLQSSFITLRIFLHSALRVFHLTEQKYILGRFSGVISR